MPPTTETDRRFLERNRDRLSKTTMRAKWTNEPAEGADRDGQTLATRSHDVIRSWADRRAALPVAASRGQDGEPRILRLAFHARREDGAGSRLERLTWEQWLDVFDRRELVFLYQERRADGSASNFFRLDNPKREDGQPRATGRA